MTIAACIIIQAIVVQTVGILTIGVLTIDVPTIGVLTVGTEVSDKEVIVLIVRFLLYRNRIKTLVVVYRRFQDSSPPPL